MIVLSTGSLHNYSIKRIFALAAEIGFDGIEVIIGRKWDTRDPIYLRGLSSQYGLPIVAIHTPFVPRLKNWPTNELKRLERTVALAQELEVQLVVAHLPLRFKRVVVKLNLLGARRFVLALPRLRKGSYFHFVSEGRLHEMESSSGIIVALENMPAHRLLGLQINAYWFNSPARMSRFSHLTLDTTHLGTWGLNPVEIYEQLKERVVHIHLSNFDGRDHRSPVDGHLPLATLLRRLAQDSYPGAISVECSPDALQAEDEGKCRLELAQRSHSVGSTSRWGKTDSNETFCVELMRLYGKESGSGPLLIFLSVCVTSQRTYRNWMQKDEGNKDWRWLTEG